MWQKWEVQGVGLLYSEVRPLYLLHFVLRVCDYKPMNSKSSSWRGCSRGATSWSARSRGTVAEGRCSRGAVAEADAIQAQFGLTMQSSGDTTTQAVGASE